MEIDQSEIDKIINIFEKDSSDLVFVLRAHLQIENILEEIIKSVFPKPKCLLEKNGLEFFDKLRLVRAMDIFPKEITTAILTLTEIRNKFAHNLDYKITPEDLDPIGKHMKEKFEELKTMFPKKVKISGRSGLEDMVLQLSVSNLLGFLGRIKEEYINQSKKHKII